jgi:hypothetical protein
MKRRFSGKIIYSEINLNIGKQSAANVSITAIS